MKEILIDIYSIVGSSNCVDVDDGEKVYSFIKRVLEQKHKAKLSFKNIEILTSAFLNVAVGRLYSEFEENFLKEALSATDITSEDKFLLKKVVDTAKAYFKNPEKFNRDIDDILEG